MLHDEDWLTPGRLMVIEAWLENSRDPMMEMAIPPKIGLTVIQGDLESGSGIQVMRVDRGLMQFPSDVEEDPWVMFTANRGDNGKPIMFGVVRRASELERRMDEMQFKGR